MSVGKYISLEEARKKNKLDRFMKTHQTAGDGKSFDVLLDNMTFKKKPKAGKTSKKA